MCILWPLLTHFKIKHLRLSYAILYAIIWSHLSIKYNHRLHWFKTLNVFRFIYHVLIEQYRILFINQLIPFEACNIFIKYAYVHKRMSKIEDTPHKETPEHSKTLFNCYTPQMLRKLVLIITEVVWYVFNLHSTHIDYVFTLKENKN